MPPGARVVRQRRAAETRPSHVGPVRKADDRPKGPPRHYSTGRASGGGCTGGGRASRGRVSCISRVAKISRTGGSARTGGIGCAGQINRTGGSTCPSCITGTIVVFDMACASCICRSGRRGRISRAGRGSSTGCGLQKRPDDPKLLGPGIQHRIRL